MHLVVAMALFILLSLGIRLWIRSILASFFDNPVVDALGFFFFVFLMIIDVLLFAMIPLVLLTHSLSLSLSVDSIIFWIIINFVGYVAMISYPVRKVGISIMIMLFASQNFSQAIFTHIILHTQWFTMLLVWFNMDPVSASPPLLWILSLMGKLNLSLLIGLTVAVFTTPNESLQMPPVWYWRWVVLRHVRFCAYYHHILRGCPLRWSDPELLKEAKQKTTQQLQSHLLQHPEIFTSAQAESYQDKTIAALRFCTKNDRSPSSIF